MSGRLKIYNASTATWEYMTQGGSNAGTSFPGSPTTNDRYYRTDKAMEFYYDGTRWVSTQVFVHGGTTPRAGFPINATAAANLLLPMGLHGGTDLWLVSIDYHFRVNSGASALSGSHKWVGTATKTVENSATETVFDTVNIDSGSSGVWRGLTQAVAALMNNGTTHTGMLLSLTKTGTPGDLYFDWAINYRVVAT